MPGAERGRTPTKHHDHTTATHPTTNTPSQPIIQITKITVQTTHQPNNHIPSPQQHPHPPQTFPLSRWTGEGWGEGPGRRGARQPNNHDPHHRGTLIRHKHSPSPSPSGEGWGEGPGRRGAHQPNNHPLTAATPSPTTIIPSPSSQPVGAGFKPALTKHPPTNTPTQPISAISRISA